MLISPPEPTPYESFRTRPHMAASSPIEPMPRNAAAPSTPESMARNTLAPILSRRESKIHIPKALPSPPFSPYNSIERKANHDGNAIVNHSIPDEHDTPLSSIVKDPPLFSRTASEPASIPDDYPLFPDGDTPMADAPLPSMMTNPLIESAAAVASAAAALIRTTTTDPEHHSLITQHMQYAAPAVSKPSRDEYLLALSCVPTVSRGYNQDPNKWYRRERDFLDQRFGFSNRVTKRTRPVNIAPAPASSKRSTAAPGTSRTGTTRRAPVASRARTPGTKRTPASKALDSFESSSTTKRTIGTSREDVDFLALPDYCPPLSTLPKNNAKVLKAEWKGQGLDLSADPHRHLLHESEVSLASTLRLSCATYLCSKRRIFQARLEALRIGKEFRKTDSQQACKIDVNKASKLWMAYDRVGWFKREYFEKFVHGPS
ncbi:MAG: hypothetical protein M1829_000022 [Trizodia sp. TS-e1964]|nr:MAG: hypothetical protein M1829_000022 [Trizodia sp. TS-e1964]